MIRVPRTCISRSVYGRGVVALLIVIVLPLASCRSSYDLSTARGQMEWGVDAADMELWREARFRFERAVGLDPSDPKMWSNLAVAYEGTGEVELARQSYLRALQLDRSNEYIQRNYSRFLEHHERGEEEEEEEEPDTGPESDDEAGADDESEQLR